MRASEVTNKPWGNFRQFTLNESSTVKILSINAGEELSLQTHKTREEYWFVIEGYPTITRGEQVFTAHPNDEILIEQGQQHRIAALDNDVLILEIAYGHFDEDDIVRLEDRYDRS